VVGGINIAFYQNTIRAMLILWLIAYDWFQKQTSIYLRWILNPDLLSKTVNMIMNQLDIVINN